MHLLMAVYQVPPRTSASGYKASDWNVESFVWKGRLRVIEIGPRCELRLEVSYLQCCPLHSGHNGMKESLLATAYFLSAVPQVHQVISYRLLIKAVKHLRRPTLTAGHCLWRAFRFRHIRRAVDICRTGSRLFTVLCPASRRRGRETSVHRYGLPRTWRSV